MEDGFFTQKLSVRVQLLTTASVLALAASAPAEAATITLEASGSWLHFDRGDTHYLDGSSVPGAVSDTFNIGPRRGTEFNGKITVQPEGSDLIFTGGIKFGRTSHRNESASGTFATSYSGTKYPSSGGGSEAIGNHAIGSGVGVGTFTSTASHRENHAIVDFEVGKDVGLGLFGQSGKSVVSAGVRYVKFTGRTDVTFHTSTKYGTASVAGRVNRSFSGAGPIIAWDASLPISDSGFSFDWGANAAVIFGKQRISDSFSYGSGAYSNSKSHSQTVPTFGAYAGLTFHFTPGAMISFGYKVDTYSNVIDAAGPSFTGFGAAQQTNRSSSGPFVKVGVVLGN